MIAQYASDGLLNNSPTNVGASPTSTDPVIQEIQERVLRIVHGLEGINVHTWELEG